MSNLKKVLALILVFTLILSMSTFVSAANFPDVPVGSKHAEAIDLLRTLGIVGGQPDGNFYPDSPITRAEFAKILFGIFNGTSDAKMYSGKSVFEDVNEDAWYVGYINWASNLGIIDGKGDGKFAPNDNVTYFEATKMYIIALTKKTNLQWPYGFVNEAKRSNINLYLDVDVSNMNANATRGAIAQMGKQAIFATDCARFYKYNMDGFVESKSTCAKEIFGIKPLYTQLLGSSTDPLDQPITSNNRVLFPQSLADVANEVSGVVADQLTYRGNTKGLAKHNVVVWYKDLDENWTLDTTDTIVYIADGINKTVTFKANDAIIDPVTGQLYANLADGTKVAFNIDDVSTSLNPLPIAYYNGKGYGETGARVTLTKDLFASFFGKKGDFTVTLLSTGLDENGYSDGKWNYAFIDQPLSNIKITDIDKANGLVTFDKLGTLSEKTGITKVIMYDGAQIGDYVNMKVETNYSNTITGMQQGSTYIVTKADVVKNVVLTKTSSVGGVTTYSFNGKNYYVNSKSVEEGLTGFGMVGERFNLILDLAGNIVGYENVNTEVSTNLGNFILITDVSSESSLQGTTGIVTGILNDGTTATFKLSPTGAYLNSGSNAWYDPNKGFYDGNVYYNEDPQNYVYENTMLLNKVFRYELDVTDKSYIAKLESLSRIKSSVGLRVNDEFLTADSIAKFQYDANTKAFSYTTDPNAEPEMVGFLSDNAIIFQYDDTNPQNVITRVIKPENLPSIMDNAQLFGGAEGGIYVDKTTMTPAIALITIKSLGTGGFGTKTSGIGAVLNVAQVFASTGYVKYEVTMAINNEIKTFETIDVPSVGDSNSFGTELVAGNFAMVNFNAENKIDSAQRAFSPASSGWAVGYVKSVPQRQNGYYGINPCDYIGTDIPGVTLPGLRDIGTGIDYYLLAEDAKVYTINESPVPDDLKTGQFKKTFTTNDIKVGTAANLIQGSQFANYVVVYHYIYNPVTKTNIIDTAFVYTMPVAMASYTP